MILTQWVDYFTKFAAALACSQFDPRLSFELTSLAERKDVIGFIPLGLTGA